MLVTDNDFHLAKDKTLGTRQNTSDGRCHLDDGMYRSRGAPVRTLTALATSGAQPCMTQNGDGGSRKKLTNLPPMHGYVCVKKGQGHTGSHRATSPEPWIPFPNLSNKFEKNFMLGLWIWALGQNTVVGH